MESTADNATIVNLGEGRDWLRIISILLAVLGIGVAGYLAYSKLFRVETVCTLEGSNCSLVQNSIYSYVGPIPVAYLGLAGYLAILAALLLETRIPFLVERGKLVVFGITLFGILFSGYLTAVEAFVLEAWCQWCVISAIIMTLLFVVSVTRLWRSFNSTPDEEEA
jgi:uncharacterized membrane protein